MAKAITADKTKTDTKPAKTGKAERPNVVARLTQYFRDVRAEMRRVVWPGRQEVINSSLVVVVTLIFFVVFTFIVDSVVFQIIDLIQRIGG